MIIKGNPAGSVKYWSKHLLRDDTNERAEVVEISGLLAEDLPTGLREMEAIAAQSRCHGNFMYQANINPRDHERLTPEQWREAVDTLEKNLGLEGHQRIVVEHEKEGRVHRHVVWNRVDVDTLRVADMGGNYYTHERTARQLEGSFTLEPTPSLHGEQRETGRPDRSPELWEQRAASRSHIDPRQIKTEITELWRSTDNGKAFVAALEDRGYVLAKGDRRDFCIVDHAGDAHSLARRIEGAKAKDVRDRMADVDRNTLPTVEEARDKQHARFPDRDAAARAWEGKPDKGGTPSGQEYSTDNEPDVASRIPRDEDRADNPTLRAVQNEVFRNDRRDRKDEAITESIEKWEAKAAAERARVDPIKPGELVKPALVVVDAATGSAETLIDFLGGLFNGSAKQPSSPAAVDQVQMIQARRKAIAALENICDSMERGEGLSPSDIQNLTPSHLENIKLRGDDYLRHLIEGIQRDRERDADYGRERER